MSNTSPESKLRDTEYGVTDVPQLGPAQSRLQSCSPVPIVAKKQEVGLFDSCLECHIIKKGKSQLPNQHKELTLKLLQHKKMSHGIVNFKGDIPVKASVTGTKTSKVLETLRSTKYTGNLCRLRNRSLSWNCVQGEDQPPEPGIKRLKGKLAKSVGIKSDGSDEYTFNPELNEKHIKLNLKLRNQKLGHKMTWQRTTFNQWKH